MTVTNCDHSLTYDSRKSRIIPYLSPGRTIDHVLTTVNCDPSPRLTYDLWKINIIQYIDAIHELNYDQTHRLVIIMRKE